MWQNSWENNVRNEGFISLTVWGYNHGNRGTRQWVPLLQQLWSRWVLIVISNFPLSLSWGHQPTAIDDEAHFKEVPFLVNKTFLEKRSSYPQYRSVSIVILYLIKLAQNINHLIHCTCISIHAYVSLNAYINNSF